MPLRMMDDGGLRAPIAKLVMVGSSPKSARSMVRRGPCRKLGQFRGQLKIFFLDRLPGPSGVFRIPARRIVVFLRDDLSVAVIRRHWWVFLEGCDPVDYEGKDGQVNLPLRRPFLAQPSGQR
jgi:hypothetical protein